MCQVFILSFSCPCFFAIPRVCQVLKSNCFFFSFLSGFLPYLGRVARMGQHVRTCQALTSATAHQVINRLFQPRSFRTLSFHPVIIHILPFPGFYGVHCSESSNSCSSGSASELCGHGRCLGQVDCQGYF